MIPPGTSAPEVPKDPVESAHIVGLRYVTDRMPGIRRQKAGRGFRFQYPTGQSVKEVDVLRRIRSLAIPPAWREVWICPDPAGHLQATGRDDRGRKQSRYHPNWRAIRDETKYAHLIAFGKALPKIRRRVERDLALPGLARNKVLASVVRLLELSLVRVGNEEYARENESYGLTTLRNRHVQVRGSNLRFHFRGKSGKWHDVSVHDRRLAKVVRSCQELPGQELFQYINDEGKRQALNSEDVNAYLRETSGQDFSAKDFRTWAGTVLTAFALQVVAEFPSQTQAKKNLVQAIKTVAQRLGNTPAVCRKCYIHPDIVQSYFEGGLAKALKGMSPPHQSKALRKLSLGEAAVLALLQAGACPEAERLKSKLVASLKCSTQGTKVQGSRR